MKNTGVMDYYKLDVKKNTFSLRNNFVLSFFSGKIING